jgi:hypothetical protein
MAAQDKLNIAVKIISKQTELVQSFDDWVILVKTNDLEAAAEMVRKANVLRTEVKELKKHLEKLNKKSGIILLN